MATSGKWTNELQLVYTMSYPMTLKMNEVEPDEATWTHLKNTAIAK